MVTKNRPSTIAELTQLVKAISGAVIVVGAATLVYLWYTAEPTLVQLERSQASSNVRLYVGWALTALALIALGSGVAWLVFAVVANIRKRMLASKIVDGRLIDNYSTRDAYGHKHQFTSVVDMDKMLNPTVRIDRNGTVNIDEYGAADVVLQANHSRQVNAERTRTSIATSQSKTAFVGGSSQRKGRGPNRNEMLAQAGYFDQQAEGQRIRNENALLQQQVLRNRLEAKPAPDHSGVTVEPITLEALPFSYALSNKDLNAVIVGQNQETGRPTKWDFTTLSHLRIHGSTNAGKSAMLKHLCAQLAFKGFALVFLDNSNMVDFRLFRYKAQLIDCKDSHVLLSALRHIWTIVEERERIIVDYAEQNPTIDGKYEDLPDNVKAQHPRMFVVLDEYADHVAEAADHGIDDDVMTLVGRLAAKARKCGIHLIFGDQKPDSAAWTTKVKQNVQAVLCAPMNSMIGTSVYGKALPKISTPFTFAFSDGDQLVKGFYDKQALADMYTQTKAKYGAMPTYIDVSGAVQQIEQKESIAHDDGLTAGVRDCVNRLIDDGYADNPNDISPKAISTRYGVSIGTVKRAKSYLKQI